MTEMHDKSFITGCDENTEWQLPWFIRNYFTFNETHLFVCDFGMSEEMVEFVNGLELNVTLIEIKSEAKGWFKKPLAMLHCGELSHKSCWLDTDCEVLADITPIFEYTQPHKITMCEDRPWTRRRGELGTWYNSGVVAFEGRPNILRVWGDECIKNPVIGDQETLYGMMNGDEIMKMSIIEPLPHKYNTLRLDYLDGIAVKDPHIIHHTGAKGNAYIKESMVYDSEND